MIWLFLKAIKIIHLYTHKHCSIMYREKKHWNIDQNNGLTKEQKKNVLNTKTHCRQERKKNLPDVAFHRLDRVRTGELWCRFCERHRRRTSYFFTAMNCPHFMLEKHFLKSGANRFFETNLEQENKNSPALFQQLLEATENRKAHSEINSIG